MDPRSGKTACLALAFLGVTAACGRSDDAVIGPGGATGQGGAGGQAGAAGAIVVERTCGVGPVGTVYGDCPDPVPVPGCPSMPEGSYTSLLGAYFCSYAGKEGTCRPVDWNDCPTGHGGLHVYLSPRAPDHPPAGRGYGDLNVVAAPGAGFTVSWWMQEQDPATFEFIGPRFEGEDTLPDICCKLVFDTYFAGADFTYRLLVQSDWDTLMSPR